MLSQEQRQELAENAMEELATCFNRAAQAMKTSEEESDLTDLQDTELHLLLEEAFNYRTIKKDKNGLSGTFKELLEKVEENSSGEEQWDINFRKHSQYQDSGGKRKKKKVSESTNKGGSLSNLSLIADSDSASRSGKRKSGRSSVSSRSREGGSLPPTKFENVVIGSSSSQQFLPWEQNQKMMCEERVPGELLHSASDSIIRRVDYRDHLSGGDTCIDIDQGDEAGDTDSNKTEVEEIEMVDMENRTEYLPDETTSLLFARQKMESRGRLPTSGPDEGIDMHSDWRSVQSVMESDRRDREEEKLDENGNQTGNDNLQSRPIHPIMENNIRPYSIYRSTPVFHTKRLTVPALPKDSNSVEEKPNNKFEKKMKVRRKKEEKNVKKSEDIEGYRGNEDVDSILQFIGAEMDRKNRKNRKSNEKNPEKMEKEKNKKNTKKEDVGTDKRKKKDKSCDKDQSKEDAQEKEEEAWTTSRKNSSKKISIDSSDTPGEDDASVKTKLEPKDSLDLEVGVAVPQGCDSIASSGRGTVSSGRGTAHSADLGGRDSGTNYTVPVSLPSTKDMSVASSPPLDLDPPPSDVDHDLDLVYEEKETLQEFTKVTKKQRKKKDRPNRHPAGSAFSEENRSRGEPGVQGRRSHLVRGSSQPQASEEWHFRSRGPVETKSTCSGPSDASDTDDLDSVHSLPVGSTLDKVSAPAHSVSSGHTPQASYADIARHAAALHTQQAGQQQNAVYREQLQYRETTPGTTKESVSSTDCDLEETAAVQENSPGHEDTQCKSSTKEVFSMAPVSTTCPEQAGQTRDKPYIPSDSEPSPPPNESTQPSHPPTASTQPSHPPTASTQPTQSSTPSTLPRSKSSDKSTQSDSKSMSPEVCTQSTSHINLNNKPNPCSDRPAVAAPHTNSQQLNAHTDPASSAQKHQPEQSPPHSDLNSVKNTAAANSAPDSQAAPRANKSSSGKVTKPAARGFIKGVSPPVVILEKQPEPDAPPVLSFGFDLNPELLARSTSGEIQSCVRTTQSTAATATEPTDSGDNLTGTSSPDDQEDDRTDGYECWTKAGLEEDLEWNQDYDWRPDEEDWCEEVEGEDTSGNWCSTVGINAAADKRNFNYDVIVDFVNQAWDNVNCEMVNGTRIVYYKIN